MKVKIIIPKPGQADSEGAMRTYTADEIVDADDDWQKAEMERMISNGWAEEVKIDAPTETKRARSDDGHYVADDPDTPDVNEAWEGGTAPAKKKAAPKKKAAAKKKAPAKKKAAPKRSAKK